MAVIMVGGSSVLTILGMFFFLTLDNLSRLVNLFRELDLKESILYSVSNIFFLLCNV